MSSLSPVLK